MLKARVTFRVMKLGRYVTVDDGGNYVTERSHKDKKKNNNSSQREPGPPVFLVMLLISINTQGLRSTTRRLAAFNFFKRLHCDIIFLQETHWTAELEHTIKQEWNGQIIFNHGSANSCGVAILFHARINNQITQP